jgi:hypothetical protein
MTIANSSFFGGIHLSTIKIKLVHWYIDATSGREIYSSDGLHLGSTFDSWY